MMYSVLISVTLFLATACVHLVLLSFCSGRMTSIPMRPSTRVLSIVTLLFITHLFQIALFASGFWIAAEVLEIGSFEGEGVNDALDYLYYSAVIYTSLGIGDIVPTGHLRFLTGVEALNGLLLIAWSASFLFATMNRLWDWEPCVEQNDEQ
ncbi:Ion channel [Tritonibacter mobilis]|nr:Ion channel [Tritonibacter mobilis]